MKPVVILFLLSVFYGCTKETPIPEDKFIMVYTDLIIAQDTSRIGPSGMDSLRAIIYERHNITRDDYTATLDYYNEKPERWETFFSKVIIRLEEMQVKRGS
jgi:hypothetical protein